MLSRQRHRVSRVVGASSWVGRYERTVDKSNIRGGRQKVRRVATHAHNLHARVAPNFIKIKEKIYFEFGKAVIQERSFSLIDEIAETVVANPQLKKIRIEGHTDSVGSDIANLKLSQSRADSVASALTSRGVESSRLDGVGFGEMRPIDTNDTDDGRAANRREDRLVAQRGCRVLRDWRRLLKLVGVHNHCAAAAA